MQIQPLRTVDIVQHGCYVNRTSCVLQAINKYNANVVVNMYTAIQRVLIIKTKSDFDCMVTVILF